jgi:hypothetical protein
MAAEYSEPSGIASPGLCRDCRNARIITGRQGSRFYLCRLAATNPRFVKYPPIPVTWCTGYDPLHP